MKSDKTIIKHYSMPESIDRLIKEWAEKASMSYSEFVRQAVRHYIYYLEDKYDGKKA